jgi:hypothetical protein
MALAPDQGFVPRIVHENRKATGGQDQVLRYAPAASREIVLLWTL